MTSPSAWQAPEVEAGPAPGVEFAGYGARLIAYIVDSLILSVVIIALVLIATALTVAVPILGILAFVALVVFGVLYFPYFWQKSGQTPGMKMLGIKVVRDVDGGSLTWGSAIIRMIGFWISGAVFYLGYIWVFIDKRRRGWHDLMASTVVVKA